MKKIFRTFQRHYSTGYVPPRGFIYNAKIPKGVGTCHYKKPVDGNGPQKIQQQKGQMSYDAQTVSEVNDSITKQLLALGVSVKPRVTAHAQTLKSALYSLSDIFSSDMLQPVLANCDALNLIDSKGCFINSIKNQDVIKRVVDLLPVDNSQKQLLKDALVGVFNNFADSVYIANDYLLYGQNPTVAFVARYPNKAIERNTERVHIVSELLKSGVLPILVNSPFEGMANLKPLPMQFNMGDQMHTFTIAYESTRSELDCIEEINDNLSKLGLPLIKPFPFRPNDSLKSTYYHMDCAFNFSVHGSIKRIAKPLPNFATLTSIINVYTSNGENKNGVVYVAKNSLTPLYRRGLDRLFKTVIELDPSNDHLIANVVALTNENGDDIVLISDKVTPADEAKIKANGIKVVKYPNNTFGGGGSHQCMKNVGVSHSPISIDDWQAFYSTKLNQRIPDLFIEALKSHTA